MASTKELLAQATKEDLDRIAASISLRDGERLTPEFLDDIIEPNYIGPTWKTDKDGNWILPERTLGWEIAGWATKWLRHPTKPEEPWRFTPEQLRFILWWYALDEDGQFLYQSGVLQRRKGWGKDPLLAVMCFVELVGPCRFSHWDDDGNPVGKPEQAALVLVSAVTREQTSNTADMFPLLMSDEFKDHYQVVPGIELIRALQGKRKIMLLTGSFRAAEGKRSTFTMLNETHHWVTSNGGPLMYDTIDGNTAKNPMSRYLAITNAFLPGEESVAESMRRDYENFKALGIDGGFLYDSVEAKARAPIGGPLLPLVLEKMLGDSIWFTVEQHVASMVRSIMKGSISPARSRRMWLNQVVADQDALIGPENWDPLMDDTLELGRSDEIVLGLDGGRSDDSTALVAIRPSDMAVFVLGMWERPEGPDGEGWRVDQKRVDEAVDRVHAQFNVVAFFSDVSGWETWIVQWEETYGSRYLTKATEQTMIGLDMRGNQKIITSSHESMLKAIIDGNIAHDGNFQLRRHVLNARRRENRWGISFGKESRESPKKVDGYAAMLLAYMAAIKIRLKAKRPEKKSGSRAFFF